MAAYNEEKYIAEAIESVLNQTFADFEFIIVDDGSTDATRSIIESYATDDPRLKLHRNDSNQGLPASLNRGIAEARGEYIARMDADDRSRPERFATQVRFLDANEHIHVAGCYVRYIGVHGEELGTWTCMTGAKDPETRKRDGPDIAHSSVMMRRSSVQAVGNYRELFSKAQDSDLWVRMAREFGPGFTGILPSILFEYRLTPGLTGRRQISSIYGSYAGDLIGNEGELRNHISTHLDRENTDIRPPIQRSMHHLYAGRLLLNDGNIIGAFKHFAIAFRESPRYFAKSSPDEL
jgi:glycosyltransferase involved in cell wall biosynthesis